MRVLVVNAGSSSLKLNVVDDAGGPEPSHLVEEWDRSDTHDIGSFLREAGQVEAVGHRVVHGGSALRGPVPVDEGVEREILALTSLAPLHQPAAVAALRAVRSVLPDVPHVACFDTAFHATMPASAATYALPEDWRSRWDLRRFGFHGLSHAYAGRRGAELAGLPGRAPGGASGWAPGGAPGWAPGRAAGAAGDAGGGLRVVTCHLGAGASLCAQLDGRSVDTTMGMTPLEGLVMATRSGTVDPGLILWLLRHSELGVDAVGEGLEKRSGLAGLSGTSGDFRELMDGVRRGEARPVLAFEVYVHRLRSLVSAMAAAVGGLDLLVFTAGVGEHSPEVREAVVSALAFLGVELDRAANEAARADAVISPVGSRSATVVVTAREDLEIANQVRQVLAGHTAPG